MALKASLAKDLVKRLSKLGRLKTITFGAGPWLTAAEQNAIVASAKKGGPRVVFEKALVNETD
ncbi:MAG: hypothetical protein Q8S33_13510 [Myxococcales bacterium]|nr:hypothetical protein [Myxococcales bacterium]